MQKNKFKKINNLAKFGGGEDTTIKQLERFDYGKQNFVTPNVDHKFPKPLIHVAFWCVITLLFYMTYRRVGGDYVWIFVLKELGIALTLFYTVSWVISKGMQVNKYRVAAFYAVGYVWWVSMTYLVCDVVRQHVEMDDRRFEVYLNFVLDRGYIGLFTFRKTADLALDYLFAVTITIGPKLVKSYVEQAKEKAHIARDYLLMELNFLKSQISPHFLFNTLNSIYQMSSKNDSRTPDAIYRLSEMMQYILYETKDDKLPLRREIQFIENYVVLSKMRYNDRVPIELTMNDHGEPYHIVPLLLIPFVENAFKHGPEKSRKQAWVQINLSVTDKVLLLHVGNNANWAIKPSDFGGIGLNNVKKQLKLHYPNRHSLEIRTTENAYYVTLEIHL